MDVGADNTSLLTAFSVCSLVFFWNHRRCEHLGLYSVVQPSDGCRKASRSSKTSSPSPHCAISAAFGMATKLVCLQESFVRNLLRGLESLLLDPKIAIYSTRPTSESKKIPRFESLRSLLVQDPISWNQPWICQSHLIHTIRIAFPSDPLA